MAKNQKSTVAAAASTSSKVKHSFEKAAKTAKELKMKKAAKRLETVANVLGILFIFLPLVVMLVKYISKQTGPKGSGLKTGHNKWVSALEVEGLKVEGEELEQCAWEGLHARAKKVKDAQEAEFDRRVANAVKKTQQGQQKM